MQGTNSAYTTVHVDSIYWYTINKYTYPGSTVSLSLCAWLSCTHMLFTASTRSERCCSYIARPEENLRLLTHSKWTDGLTGTKKERVPLRHRYVLLVFHQNSFPILSLVFYSWSCVFWAVWQFCTTPIGFTLKNTSHEQTFAIGISDDTIGVAG